MPKEATSYEIRLQIPPTYAGNLYEFMYRQFLLPQGKRFADITRAEQAGEPSLAFTVRDTSGTERLRVHISGKKHLTVEIDPLVSGVSEQEISRSKEDIDIAVDFFEEQVRKNTLFFAWSEGDSIVPERASGSEDRSLRRMFLETQILLMILFMGIGLLLFSLVGPLLPLVLLAVQFVFIFYSNKIVARSADWRITKGNPLVHILEYSLPLDEHETLVRKITKDQVVRLKRELYEEAISRKGELDCQAASAIFSRYGIECKPENMVTRRVNVFEIVKRVADRFSFPVPEIVVSNAGSPNAAASGPSPGRGLVLMTTGLFVQLEDEEITSVLGHEFGHLRGRDPIWLYGLSAVQYLFWFYVVLGFLPFDSLIAFFIYYWAISTVTYFIAKFFEARADLTSAVMIGQPQTLANALEKIGFRRLLYERSPAFRVQEWISLDPHPPIYFRIARLRKLTRLDRMKHPLIQSAKDVTMGFFGSLS